MKRYALAITAVLSLLVGCFTGSVVSSLMVPEVRAGTNPPRWEHICTTTSGDMRQASQLGNQMGAKRWEMVTSGVTSTGMPRTIYWCFKRPMQ